MTLTDASALLDEAAAAHEEAAQFASTGQHERVGAAYQRAADLYARAGYPDLAATASGLAALYAPGPAAPPATTCIEHAYGSAQRLSFQIKVF